MKMLIMNFFIFLLSGCFIYSSKDDCIYGLTSTQCFGEAYPPIAHYQKPYSLGKTNAELRRKDIKNCGGFFNDMSDQSYAINGARDKNNRIIFSVVEEFENCMKKKDIFIFQMMSAVGKILKQIKVSAMSKINRI